MRRNYTRLCACGIPAQHFHQQQYLCDDCYGERFLDQTPEGGMWAGESSPWLENAVRAMEDANSGE